MSGKICSHKVKVAGVCIGAIGLISGIAGGYARNQSRVAVVETRQDGQDKRMDNMEVRIENIDDKTGDIYHLIVGRKFEAKKK